MLSNLNILCTRIYGTYQQISDTNKIQEQIFIIKFDNRTSPSYNMTAMKKIVVIASDDF